jgi:pyrrolidone-carboxylate peptidase
MELSNEKSKQDAILSYEEQLGRLAWNKNSTVQDYFSYHSPLLLQAYTTLLEARLSHENDPIEFESWLKNSAQDFFNASTLEVDRTLNSPDDRPLYWSRLKFMSLLKTYASKGVPGFSLDNLLHIFEEGSRNYTGIDFSPAPADCKKILITGFDPFLLNSRDYPGKHNHRQSNPSGCVALTLHNTYTPNHKGFIQSMIFPVRYSDFDSSSATDSGIGEGVVERYIGPWIDKVDLLITLSQGRPQRYDIEQFASILRGGQIDNLGHRRIENSPCINSSRPWIATSLPLKMIETPVTMNDSYQSSPCSPIEHGLPPTPDSLIFNAPGGNYLSNEIFYRVARLRELWREEQAILTGIKPIKASGHFHLPKLQDPGKVNSDGSYGEDINHPATVEVIQQVLSALNRAVA